MVSALFFVLRGYVLAGVRNSDARTATLGTRTNRGILRPMGWFDKQPRDVNCLNLWRSGYVVTVAPADGRLRAQKSSCREVVSPGFGRVTSGAFRESLPTAVGARRRVQSPSEGRQNPAIQIACQSRKTDRFQDFSGRPCRLRAEDRVTAAGKLTRPHSARAAILTSPEIGMSFCDELPCSILSLYLAVK